MRFVTLRLYYIGPAREADTYPRVISAGVGLGLFQLLLFPALYETRVHDCHDRGDRKTRTVLYCIKNSATRSSSSSSVAAAAAAATVTVYTQLVLTR